MRRLLAITVIFGVCGIATGHADDPINTGLAAVPAAPRFESIARLLGEPATDAAARTGLARELTQGLDRAVIPEDQLAQIHRILRGERGVFARATLLEVLAQTPQLPESLLTQLTWLFATSPDEELLPLSLAIANIQTRAAAKALLEVAEGSTQPTSQAAQYAAMDGLVRLSGNDQFGHDVAQWRRWVADAAAMDSSTWLTALARGQARRATRSEAAVEAVRARLLDSHRQLYLASDPEAQDQMLAALLDAAESGERALGFEILNRELADSHPIGPAAGEASLRLLTHADPITRRNAAIVISRFVPSAGSRALSQALSSEVSPEVAASMLSAARAYADSLEPAALARWLKESGETQAAAVELGYDLLRAGRLNEPGLQAELLQAAREQLESRNAAWSVCHILGQLGAAQDQAQLVRLLGTPGNQGKLAAADTLCGYEEFTDPIIFAAQHDPDLFVTAARVCVLFRTDLAGFRTLASLPTPDMELRRRSLLQLAKLTPAADVLTAARTSNEDPSFIEGLLGTLAAETRILSERASPEQLRAIADGLTWLGSLLMDRGKADEALAAMAALPELDEQTSDLPGVTCTRLAAWISLGRFGEVDSLNATPTDWMNAIKRCGDKKRAIEAAALVRKKFQLKPEEDAALAKIVEP